MEFSFYVCFFLHCIHNKACQGKLYLEDCANIIIFCWADELPLHILRTNSELFQVVSILSIVHIETGELGSIFIYKKSLQALKLK